MEVERKRRTFHSIHTYEKEVFLENCCPVPFTSKQIRYYREMNEFAANEHYPRKIERFGNFPKKIKFWNVPGKTQNHDNNKVSAKTP